LQLAISRIQFSHFEQVGHQIVQPLGFFFAVAGNVHLQRLQRPGKAARERVEREAQPLQRIAQLLRGDHQKARLEAVHCGHLRNIFEQRHRSQQPPAIISNGRGPQPVAVLGLPGAHGQQCGLALSGGRALHRNRVANGLQNAVSARRIGQRIAV